MAIDIRPVVSDEEREAVYRFRYEIYVEEMGRRQRYADHHARRIMDPLDARCHVLAAWEGGQVIGTVRINHLADCDIGEYMQLYSLDGLPYSVLENTTITTRLMVASRLRKSTLGIRISCALYEHGLRSGVTDDFIDCNAHLVRLFTGLGYRLHRSDLVHAEYGAVTVMRLSLTDIAHLETIRSPFGRIFRNVMPNVERENASIPELVIGAV